MSNFSSYKTCFVPGCENTTFSAPEKLFFNVPRNERRVEWCAAAGVQKELSLKSTHCCCADHFNVEEDVENWQQYHYLQKMGMKARLRLKRDVLPHIFRHSKKESTSKTNKAIFDEDESSQFEGSEPVSYLATAVLGDQGDSGHAESIEPMSVDKESSSPATTVTPVLDEPEPFNRILDVKSLGSNVPEHLLNYVVSLHNELLQKKIECQKSKQKASRLQEEVEVLRSGIYNGAETESCVNEYEIQDTRGKKVRCFAVDLSGLNYLHKKGVVSDPNVLLKTEEKGATDSETNESSDNDNSENGNSTNAKNHSDISILQSRVLALESECNTLRSANSQLINEKAEVLNEYHKLKAELKKLWKDHWNLQMLNTQLMSDNEKLLESLKEMENSPND